MRWWHAVSRGTRAIGPPTGVSWPGCWGEWVGRGGGGRGGPGGRPSRRGGPGLLPGTGGVRGALARGPFSTAAERGRLAAGPGRGGTGREGSQRGAVAPAGLARGDVTPARTSEGPTRDGARSGCDVGRHRRGRRSGGMGSTPVAHTAAASRPGSRGASHRGAGFSTGPGDPGGGAERRPPTRPPEDPSQGNGQLRTSGSGARAYGRAHQDGGRKGDACSGTWNNLREQPSPASHASGALRLTRRRRRLRHGSTPVRGTGGARDTEGGDTPLGRSVRGRPEPGLHTACARGEPVTGHAPAALRQPAV